MDLEECTVIFIGEKLKNLSKYKSYPFHTQYLESSDQFFEFYSTEQERLQHSIVFHHFLTSSSWQYLGSFLGFAIWQTNNFGLVSYVRRSSLDPYNLMFIPRHFFKNKCNSTSIKNNNHECR